jgi:hypothetical protein
MSGLFNGNSSVVQLTADAKEVETPMSSNSGDFSAAIASIGTAIGELKEAFPSMMERALNTAISSDTTNNALYDALASATYDSMTALHDEGKLGPNEREKSSEAETRGGRGFTRAELLAIETLDQNEQLANAISTAFDRSLEKSKFDRAADVGATAANAAADTTIDAMAGTSGNVSSRTIANVKKGETDVSDDYVPGKDVAGVTDTASDELEQGTGGSTKRPPEPSEPAPEGQKYVYDKGTGEYVTRNEKFLDDEIDSTKKPSPVQGGIVESGADISRKRMMDDMSMNFMSKTAPDFMSKGNEVFDKILNDELTVHLDEDIGQSVGMSMQNLPWGSMLKGGGMLALGSATIASLGAIATAGKELWDWHKANKENEKNLDQIAENSVQANERMKNGVNDDLRDANIKDDKASVELAKAENGIGNSILGAFGYKSEEIREKEAAKMQAKAEQAIEQRRYRELLDRAEAYGIKRTDSEAVKKWVEEQKKLATAAGVNVEDKGAFIRFQNEELKRYKEAQKKAVEQGTQPNRQGQGQQGQKGQQSNKGAPDAANQANGAPMAAGSNTNTTQNTVNAGTGAMTEDILSAEERLKQYKLYTFEGIRDALLLPEVQAMFSATAQTAGASVEQKLMG